MTKLRSLQHLIFKRASHWRSPILSGSFLLLLTLTLAACGSGSDTADAPAPLRTPRPTFTPTGQPGAASQPNATTLITDTGTLSTSQTTEVTPEATIKATVPVTEEVANTTTTPAATPTGPLAPVKAIVNTPLVNMRSGPGTNFPMVYVVDRGYEMDIIGKNAKGDWWKVCCVEETSGWIDMELADTEGPVDSVPVVQEGADSSKAATTEATTVVTPPAQATTAPAPATPDAAATATPAVAATSAPTSTTGFDFDLIVQEQFPETKLVRIFLYVYDRDNTALEGYSLKVTKDGAEVPVTATSAGQSGFTWPVADVRQRFQNLKLEFPSVAAVGAWTIQLSKDGTPVGPAATFTLKANDPSQELYVRYERH
ncbi:MAG: SH3 domain-containing protein [Chloroflexi bacterium]|nr:SH3 domain-containing protein [Chloroflexota bacterium]